MTPVPLIQVFNRAAYVAVDVVKAKGRGRLQFSRQPFTHWSFAFYEVCTCIYQLMVSLCVPADSVSVSTSLVPRLNKPRQSWNKTQYVLAFRAVYVCVSLVPRFFHLSKNLEGKSSGRILYNVRCYHDITVTSLAALVALCVLQDAEHLHLASSVEYFSLALQSSHSL